MRRKGAKLGERVRGWGGGGLTKVRLIQDTYRFWVEIIALVEIALPPGYDISNSSRYSLTDNISLLHHIQIVRWSPEVR